MQIEPIIEVVFRWFHVVAGILWIGLLYFFNWVNSAFAPTLDAESKKKVVPQLMPRALFWFRWGAAWTWLTGVILLAMVFYHGGALFDGAPSWTLPTFVMTAVIFIGPFIYDAIMKTLGAKNIKAAVVLCFLIVAGIVYLDRFWAGWSFRGYNIHVGGLFGTIMAYNVWFRIWPSQRKIITAVRDGQAPDPAVVALAGLRSKQNTYMSVPLVWTMLNYHVSITLASNWWWSVLVVIAFGWFATSHLFKKAPKVPGF